MCLIAHTRRVSYKQKYLKNKFYGVIADGNEAMKVVFSILIICDSENFNLRCLDVSKCTAHLLCNPISFKIQIT